MTESPDRVFLDANIVFSCALGGRGFQRLVRFGLRGQIHLITSLSCVAEARENLTRKRPDRLQALEAVLDALTLDIFDIEPFVEWALALVNEDDVHVLASARAAEADYLVTGDRKDFANLFARTDLGLVVVTPADFLRAGPPI